MLIFFFLMTFFESMVFLKLINTTFLQTKKRSFRFVIKEANVTLIKNIRTSKNSKFIPIDFYLIKKKKNFFITLRNGRTALHFLDEISLKLGHVNNFRTGWLRSGRKTTYPYPCMTN